MTKSEEPAKQEPVNLDKGEKEKPPSGDEAESKNTSAESTDLEP